MALPLTINGQVFEYPQTFDEDWGVDATGWAQAVTAGALYLSGGNFPLTATVDFGSSFGIKVKSITSKTANPATAGYLLLAKTDAIEWRNNANSGNLVLAIDGSNNLTFNGTPLGTTSLTNTHIFVGNASNVPTDVAMSGDATIANTGALTIANSAITNAKVSASAAIAVSKLATLTASRAVVTDSGGLLAVSAVTATELGYSSGLTGNIQTQLATYLPLSGGTMSGAINMASHKITSVTNGTAAGDAVAYNQLRILQVVSAANTTPFTTSSTSYVTTNTTATITPTSTASRVFIIASGTLASNGAANAVVSATIFAGGGSVVPSANGLAQAVADGITVGFVPCTMTFLDTPVTIAAYTYTVAVKVVSGVTTAQWGTNNITTTITLFEVA